MDATHYYLGDTNPADVLCTDEECTFALANNGNHPMLAAASIAETKAAQFLYRPTMVKRGDRITSYADQAQAFLTLARQLRNNASLKTATLYAGGIGVGDKEANSGRSGNVRPFARKDLHTGPPRASAGRVYDVDAEERDL